MTVFVALLRGINVSGHRVIRMAALRASLEALGFANVRTYVQSGNVVFETAMGDASKHAASIHARIQKDFGHDVPTVVLAARDFLRVADSNPWLEEIGGEAKFFHALFSAEPISKAKFAKLELPIARGERVLATRFAILLHAPRGYGESKLTNTFFEKALGTTVTARNWNTVLALRELCQSG